MIHFPNDLITAGPINFEKGDFRKWKSIMIINSIDYGN